MPNVMYNEKDRSLIVRGVLRFPNLLKSRIYKDDGVSPYKYKAQVLLKHTREEEEEVKRALRLAISAKMQTKTPEQIVAIADKRFLDPKASFVKIPDPEELLKEPELKDHFIIKGSVSDPHARERLKNGSNNVNPLHNQHPIRFSVEEYSGGRKSIREISLDDYAALVGSREGAGSTVQCYFSIFCNDIGVFAIPKQITVLNAVHASYSMNYVDMDSGETLEVVRDINDNEQKEFSDPLADSDPYDKPKYVDLTENSVGEELDDEIPF